MKRWAIILCLLAAPTMAAETGSIATGSPSGLYYPFGGGLAQIWSDSDPTLNFKAEVTGASVVNIIQVAKGESRLGISQGDALRDAIEGRGIFPHPMKVRALFALYPNIVHAIAPADSDIKSLKDLRGKRVSIGAPGSGTAITTLNLLAAMGISKEDFKPQYLSYTETAEGLQTGSIDAGFIVGGLGVSALVELALTQEIRLLNISDQDMQHIRDQFPAYNAVNIPAATYQGVTEPVQTVTLWNFMIAPDDMPEPLAYQLTKTAFEHMDEMLRVTKAAKFATVENSLTYAEPLLHPGALRYMREVSVGNHLDDTPHGSANEEMNDE